MQNFGVGEIFSNSNSESVYLKLFDSNISKKMTPINDSDYSTPLKTTPILPRLGKGS